MILLQIQQLHLTLVVETQMLSNEQFANLANQGGASRSFKTGKSPKGPGIMVSIPGAEKITDAPYTAEQAQNFKTQYANSQIAGYDLGGTDKRRMSGGNVYFGRKVPGVESNPEFVASAHATSEIERMEPKPKAQEFAEQSHISRGATNKGKKISVNEVYATIAKNRRNRGV